MDLFAIQATNTSCRICIKWVSKRIWLRKNISETRTTKYIKENENQEKNWEGSALSAYSAAATKILL